MTGLLDMGPVTGMITDMMIMTTDLVPLIKARRTAVKGIMIMEDTVMILTMREVVEEMVTGEDVNLGIVNGTREA